MATGQVKLPPGFELESTLPPGFELEEPKPPGVGDALRKADEYNPIRGLMGGIGSVAQSIPAAAGAGLYGIWQAAGNGPPGAGAQGVEDAMGVLAPPADTAFGRGTATALSYIPQLIGQGIDWVGKGMTSNMSRLGMPPEVAAGVGTTANVGLNAILMGLGSGPLRPKVTVPQAVPLSQIEQLRLNAGQNLPVPVELTRGQAKRDPALLREEELIAQTKEGQAIRERHIEQNRAIIENLETMKDRTAPKSNTMEDVGRRVAQERERGNPKSQEGALAMAERKSNENVGALYAKARNSPENNMPVTPQPMIDWITENGAAAASVPEINSVAQTLKRFGAVDFDAQGRAIARRDLTIGEMEEIRKLATKLGNQPGTPASHYMRELKERIDWTTADAGGDLYKAARQARNKHALEYEEPKAIAQLLDSKSRTDRQVALEDVWHKTVLGGSISDLERVRTTLLNAKDRKVRDAGRKAWRDIAGSTIDYIREEATKSVSIDASGNMNVSPAAMKRVIDKIGPQKLDLILGKSSADQIRTIAQVTQDVKTLPPSKVGSTTASNFMAMMDGMERQLGHIPFIGSPVRGGIQLMRELGKSGARLKMTEEALNYPPTPGQPHVRLRDIGPSVAKLSMRLTPALGLRRPEEEN